MNELGEEHVEEIKNLEYENKLLKTQKEVVFLFKNKISYFFKELTTSLENLCEKQSSLIEDRRFFEDSVTLLKEDLVRKNALIEELENQVEDCRHNDKSTSQNKINSTYKIDDATLKELFFSYFLAEKKKQPEIALVMSSILGYSPEVIKFFFILLFIIFFRNNLLFMKQSLLHKLVKNGLVLEVVKMYLPGRKHL